MKTKLLTLFSLLALLLVSAAVLADGRPTGIRIGRLETMGMHAVEIDITVPATEYPYTNNFWGTNSSSLHWLGNNYGGGTFTFQYMSPGQARNQPYAIDWGDGGVLSNAFLEGAPGGPFTGTFQHTYLPSGSLQNYTITVGDLVCCSPVNSPSPSKGFGITTGNAITGTLRYVVVVASPATFTSTANAILAVTATTTVTTQTAIPTLNIYGLLAMAFVLVGTGVLLFRRPQQA